VIIAGIVLLPEGLAALRPRARIACRPVSPGLDRRCQHRADLPAVSFVSLYMKSHLRLGIDAQSTLLLCSRCS